MSLVTNIIFTTAVGDEDMEAVFAEALKLCDPPIPPPIRVDQRGSLGKVMEANVYIGAYNYLRLDDLVRSIEIVAWQRPEEVRLFVDEQNNEHGFHEVLLHLPGERRKIEGCDPPLHRVQRRLSPGEEADLMKPPYYCMAGGCTQRPVFLCYGGQLWCGAHCEIEGR